MAGERMALGANLSYRLPHDTPAFHARVSMTVFAVFIEAFEIMGLRLRRRRGRKGMGLPGEKREDAHQEYDARRPFKA
jgi:hypothetical protein